jgi:hypothetical protein
MAVACTTPDLSTTIHRQQMPAVIVVRLHVPTVGGELRGPQCPIGQIDTASYSLYFAQPTRMFVSVDATPRERFGDEGACGGQQD